MYTSWFWRVKASFPVNQRKQTTHQEEKPSSDAGRMAVGSWMRKRHSEGGRSCISRFTRNRAHADLKSSGRLHNTSYQRAGEAVRRWSTAPSFITGPNYDFTCTALQNPSLTLCIVKRGKMCGDWVCGFRGMLSCPETCEPDSQKWQNDIMSLCFVRVYLSDLQGGGLCQ